jgi:hypothetical protein
MPLAVRISPRFPLQLRMLVFVTSLAAGLAAAESPPVVLAGWDRVPLYVHFGKRAGELTSTELDFLAANAPVVALEKSHGAAQHGSTEAGIAATARELKRRNPGIRVLFYLNAFINWPGYAAHRTYRDEWTLRDARGEIVRHPSGTPRPDPSQAAFREWWADVVAGAHRDAPLDGLFADALPQALSPALARQVGAEKARAVVAGLREMLALTKSRLGPGKIIVVNGTRTTDFREILDWEGIDGVMIEHFAAFGKDAPADIKADLDTLALAAARRKFAVIKGWPGFNWLDREMMARPRSELLALARERVTFPLACFLIAAQPGSLFAYSWGYTADHGMLEPYAEFSRKLGPPTGAARWEGLSASRDFAHASVRVDLASRTAQIDWK